MKITINNTDITLKFGYGFLRLLGEMWNCAGPVAITDRFLKGAGVLIDQVKGLDTENIDAAALEGRTFEVPFEAVDVFVDIILAAARAENKESELDRDAVGDFVFANTNLMGEILKLFMASLPKVNTEAEGKPKAAEAKPLLN